MKDFMIRCLFLMAFLSMAVGCGKYELEISPYYNWCDNYHGKRFVLNTTGKIHKIELWAYDNPEPTTVEIDRNTKYHREDCGWFVFEYDQGLLYVDVSRNRSNETRVLVIQVFGTSGTDYAIIQQYDE